MFLVLFHAPHIIHDVCFVSIPYHHCYPESPTPDEKKLIQLDAQAKDVICTCLSKSQFISFKRFESAKEIWDGIETVYEEFQAQRDAHSEMFRAMFNHIWSL